MSHIGVVPEILRGIRAHFAKLVKGLTEKNSSKAQLGLGHSYSRAKVKFNVNKSDNMIIQVFIFCNEQHLSILGIIVPNFSPVVDILV